MQKAETKTRSCRILLVLGERLHAEVMTGLTKMGISVVEILTKNDVDEMDTIPPEEAMAATIYLSPGLEISSPPPDEISPNQVFTNLRECLLALGVEEKLIS